MFNLFSKGRLSHYPNGFAKRLFSRKSMLKNAYLQSRKELHSSVFEEIHEYRFFFLKKEFIQPVLYGAQYYLDIHQ